MLAALAVMVGSVPAAAQEPSEAALVRTSAFVAGSLREGLDGFGVARDVRSLSFRVAVPRRQAMQPWLQLGRFVRPDLECPQGVACNVDGWTALVGAVFPLSADATRPGVHPHLVGGVGGAFSAQDKLVYLLGVGAAVPLAPRVAPVIEFRWEDLPGIRNVLMATFGLRVDLF